MRVILKPGGVATVLLALAGLGTLAVRGTMGREAAPTPAISAVSPVLGTPAWSGLMAGSGSVINGDFSGAFVAPRFFGFAPEPDNKSTAIKAHISGMIADPWLDNSNWADVTARYARATESDGNVCQKIQLDRMNGGRLQMAQFLQLVPEKSYRVTCRLRADTPCRVNLGFISFGEKPGSQQDVNVETDWKRFDVKLTAVSAENLLVIALTQAGSVVYVDDVKIDPVVSALTKVSSRAK